MGYNPQINIYRIFHSLNFVIFRDQILSKGIGCEYIVSVTPPTVLCDSFRNIFVIFFFISFRFDSQFRSQILSKGVDSTLLTDHVLEHF